MTTKLTKVPYHRKLLKLPKYVLLWTASIITLLSFEACWEEVHPDKLELPKITTTGENTFGCLIDGEIWAANGAPSCTFCGPNPGARVDHLYYSNVADTFSDMLSLGARNAYKDLIAQELSISFTLTDTYILGDTINAGSTRWTGINFYDELNKCYIESDSTTSISIIVNRYDREVGIVSGTFSGELTDSCRALSISDGRFDLTFRPKL